MHEGICDIIDIKFMSMLTLIIDISQYINIVIMNSLSNIILVTINFQIMTIYHIT